MNIIKRFRTLILSVILLSTILAPNICHAATNRYNYHDCTWTAWQYAYDNLGIALPHWGYASQWVVGAQRDGYATGMTPAVNSVSVWYGHVGFVTQVSADGQSVYIVEGGWGSGDSWLHKGWYAACGSSSSGKPFLGYIYLDGVPSNTTPDTPQANETTESTPDTPQTNETTESTPDQSEPSNASSNQAASDNDASEPSDLTEVVDEDENAQRELELALLRAKKENLTAQIAETENTINDLNEQLNQANQANEERVRTMYMLGNESYLEILFSSVSISDFFSKAEQINNIITLDRETIRKIESLTEEITAKKSELEQALAELNQIYI